VRPEFAALDASIAGEVINPESPEYESVRGPAWAQYANIRPEAVVRCKTPADVAESLAVARRLDLEVAPRGGGALLRRTLCDRRTRDRPQRDELRGRV
jgi:FAD/FMN-containing dehydrogenase